MEQWEYSVANRELNEIDGSYTWVCAIGRETIGRPPQNLTAYARHEVAATAV